MSAAKRGWGPGWPTDRSDDQRKVTVGDVTVFMHREIAELVGMLMVETERRGYNLKGGWCWGYAHRPIRGTRKTPSNHSWGLALDINAPNNPMSSPLRTDISMGIVDLWESYGFEWGGNWNRPDPMHFEFTGTPEQARRSLERARRELGHQPVAPTPPAPTEPVYDRPTVIWGEVGQIVKDLQFELAAVCPPLPAEAQPTWDNEIAQGHYGEMTKWRVGVFAGALGLAWLSYDASSVTPKLWWWLDAVFTDHTGQPRVWTR